MDKVPNWLMLKHAQEIVKHVKLHISGERLFFEPYKLYQGTVCLAYNHNYGSKIEFYTKEHKTTILEFIAPNTIISSLYDDSMVGNGKLLSYSKCNISFNEEEYFQNSCVENNSWICLHDMLELYQLNETLKELHGELK